jgi:hypothetical protein
MVLLVLNSSNLTNVNNDAYLLEITKLELGLNKPVALTTYKSENRLDSIIGNNTTVKEVAEILNSTDTILLKQSKRINIRFINKTNTQNPKTIILKELKNHFN